MARGKGVAKVESLTQGLGRFVARELLPDLLERSKQPAVEAALRAEFDDERRRQMTAATFIAWRTAWLEQVAAAWALACVFVRTLEDRELLGRAGRPGARRLAGVGADGSRAEDSEARFFRLFPRLGVADYLRAVFREVANLPGGAAVLGPEHNPLYALAPSAQACRGLLDLLREPDAADAARLRWRFAAEDDAAETGAAGAAEGGVAPTRFLGDLYQDLSEPVRKRYALLQTPDFVEAMILDHTLEPAVREFGLAGLRVLDPACGSGHFLLGAFERLLGHWRREAPGLSARERANRALAAVHGIDINPYAIAITRFRLTLAWLDATGTRSLADAPALPMALAVGDSLLAEGQQGDFFEVAPEAGFGKPRLMLEEPAAAAAIGRQRYHVVVANPPYITVTDKARREAIRERYTAAAGKYALSAPFAQRIVELGAEGGFSGQITANSFMKREFGKALVEQVLPRWDVTEVIDTSGAYIPGHGTPTVILFARARQPTSTEVRVVQGRRGEPGVPENAARGLVWLSILEGLAVGGGAGEGAVFENAYVTVQRAERVALASHPWSLQGGGADVLKEAMEVVATSTIESKCESIGISSFTLEDDVYILPAKAWHTRGVDRRWLRPMVTGDIVRDYSIVNSGITAFPYDRELSPSDPKQEPALYRYLWAFRTNLSSSKMFGGQTKVEYGLKWYEFGRFTASKLLTPLSIPFAFVATHNHFVLDRGGKVFNRTAPVIKLPAEADEAAHLELLGVLNSSAGCFWMKQVFHNKGYGADSQGARTTADVWEDFYEFDSTKVRKFPLVATLGLSEAFATTLDALARTRATDSPIATLHHHAASGPDALRRALAARRDRDLARLFAMVALQEELDWAVYAAYDLLRDVPSTTLATVPPTAADVAALVAAAQSGEADPRTLETLVLPTTPAPLRPGQRAFELALARRDAAARAAIADDEEPDEPPTAWFERHGWTPVTDVATIADPATRARVQARLDAIDADRNLGLLEAPEHKRRWYAPDFAATEAEAMTTLLQDRLEAFAEAAGRVVSVREAASALGNDPAVRAVAALLDHNDKGLPTLLQGLLLAEGVPYLARLRFRDAGLEKFAAWREVWELQRREDQGETGLDIPVPPRYARTDYSRDVYWTLRGKLDVPKERYVLYPDAESELDPSPRFGWAGWNHAERARALAALVAEARRDGWGVERCRLLLEGLRELVFWLELWHGEPDVAFRGAVPAAEIGRFLEAEGRRVGLG